MGVGGAKKLVLPFSTLIGEIFTASWVMLFFTMNSAPKNYYFKNESYNEVNTYKTII